MSNVIRTFGIWQVTEDGMNSIEPYEYVMGIDDVFTYRDEDGKKVWDFPIHLTEKTWLTGSNAHYMQEFNDAFRFAQEYFKAERPEQSNDVDDNYTWIIQRQMMR